MEYFYRLDIYAPLSENNVSLTNQMFTYRSLLFKGIENEK